MCVCWFLHGWLCLTGMLGGWQPLLHEVPVPNDSSERDSELHGAFHSGALIGTLERVLMIVLIVMSQYEAIGFLIAARSILRFSSVNESEKSEYVVAGTFISFCIALFLGLLVVKL